jgi:peptide/nickel transport system permease protein
MGFLTGLLWLAAVIIAAMAAGWVFRAAAIAVSPHGVAKEFRTMPLTAGFGLLMILIYILVAILAPDHCALPRSTARGTRWASRSPPRRSPSSSALSWGCWRRLSAAGSTSSCRRTVDVLMAIPALIFALLLLTIVGTSVINMILVIAVIDATRVFRLARAVAEHRGDGLYRGREAARRGPLGISSRERSCPTPPRRWWRSSGCASASSSSDRRLSFLGLGIQPPTADWGSMVRDNATLISFGDITPLIPAAPSRF